MSDPPPTGFCSGSASSSSSSCSCSAHRPSAARHRRGEVRPALIELRQHLQTAQEIAIEARVPDCCRHRSSCGVARSFPASDATAQQRPQQGARSPNAAQAPPSPTALPAQLPRFLSAKFQEGFCLIVKVLSGGAALRLRHGAGRWHMCCTRRRLVPPLAASTYARASPSAGSASRHSGCGNAQPNGRQGAQAVMRAAVTQLRRRTLAAQGRQHMQQYAGIQAAAERHQQPLLLRPTGLPPRR